MESLNQIEHKIDQQGQKIDAQSKMMAEIHTVIAGNPKYGQKGIKDVLEDHDKRIAFNEAAFDSYKRTEWKRTAKVAGVSASLGASIGILAPKALLSKAWAFISNIL